MRLTTVILIASILQVSAATFAQQITIDRKNASLESLLKEIRTQSNFDFFYDAKIIPKDKLVDISVKNVDINQALKKILSGSSLTYKIEGKIVTIKKQSEPTFIDKIISVFEQIDIRGKVVDENGKPMAGASVFVADSETKTTTNANGEFFLENISENATILIGFVGYLPIERPAARAMGTIKMVPATANLEEVQVTFNTGYEKIDRARSAGSIVKPDLKVVLNRSTSTNLIDRLEGLVPGLSSGSGGQRGGVVIRGTTSLNVSTTPLIVVDGIPGVDINTINVQDIESVNVLKDATSASIWGAQAANGVVVITTKKGVAGDKVRIDYDGYYAFQGRTDRDYLPRLTTAQSVGIARELFLPSTVATSYNQAISEGAMNPLTQILWNEKNGTITAALAQLRYDSLSRIDNLSSIEDQFIRDAATLNQTISLSGGGKVHTFNASINHIGSQNNTPNNRNNQYKINLNNNFTLSDRIRLNLAGDLTNRVIRTQGIGDDGVYAILTGAPRYQLFNDANGNPLNLNYLAPVTAPYGIRGYHETTRLDYQTRSRINLDYNPLQEIDRQYATTNSLGARIVGGGTIDILKGLKFTGTYGYNYFSISGREVLDQDNYNVRNQLMRFTRAANATATPIYNLPREGGRLMTDNSVEKAWTIRNQLSYGLDWEKNQISVMAGQEASSSQSIGNSTTYYGWDDQLQTSRPVDFDRLKGNVNGGVAGTFGNLPVNVSGGEGVIVRRTSYFATGGYTFDKTYTLNASWRIDQTNLFGLDKSAQNRPVYSFGAKWALANETFMKPVSWLNSLDLRFSYGITGNAPEPGQAASYDILEAETNPQYVSGVGLILRTPKNDKLTWERTQVYNGGLDFSILNGRLNGQIDAYLKNTTDLIGSLATSPLTGYASVIGNFGDLQNKGIDIGLNSVNLRTMNFEWNTGVVVSYNKNKLVKLNMNAATTASELIGFENGLTRVVGQPLFLMYSYDYAGLNVAGDPQVRLADGTFLSEPNVALPVDAVLSGLAQAPWNGGLSNNFRYKNFNLGINVVYSLGYKMRDPRSGVSTTDPQFLNRWKATGDEDITEIPRWLLFGSDEAAARDLDFYRYSNRRVMDASYAKIRDITLDYGLPQNIVRKLSAQAINFRFQLSNLLLWTANDLNYDPEASGFTRPAQGTVTLGAHITF
jgi:TonB-linked SusC/RagA family outer membrane protein